MDSEPDIRSLRLSSLPSQCRTILSILMNAPKIIPADGPDKLRRDWRGLARLLNISSEIAASFQEFRDKTSKVLELWMQDRTASLGQLLDFLKRLDRYDVHDDLCKSVLEHYESGELVVNKSNELQLRNNQLAVVRDWEQNDMITFEDAPGCPHIFDAFVLYADEDQDFVDELNTRMTKEGFQICTKENLLPGLANQYWPVGNLISERCKRIILVFSPDFLRSYANSFYRKYAQAISIESRTKKIIPVMYRECQLPTHLLLYFTLRYDGRPMYDFWDKLKRTLNHSRTLGLQPATSSHSGLNIVELTTEDMSGEEDNRFFLPRNSSMNDVNRLTVAEPPEDSQSLGSISQNSMERKKKTGPLKKIFNTLKGKKSKKSTERYSPNPTDCDNVSSTGAIVA